MPTLGEPEVSEWNVRFPVLLSDGSRVEAVLYRGDTVCISSQVGCAVRCPFCASGADGLGRSLEVHELVGQVDAVRAHAPGLRRVTVSGVGEPLHNAAAVLATVYTLRARGTPASVTTSGGTEATLGALLAAPHNGVTVSMHAGTEATRKAMVPHGPSLDALGTWIARALEGRSRNARKKVALAYLLVRDGNDGDDELAHFADRARALDLPVHLYALNRTTRGHAAPVTRDRYEAAYALLRGKGLVVRMSSAARLDANGGCGTLLALRRPPAPREARS